jgi:hypothetical protein
LLKLRELGDIMSTRFPGSELDHYLRMASEWGLWRDRLRGFHSGDATDPLEVLARVSLQKGTWQLAIAAAAYALLPDPDIAQERPGDVPEIIWQSLNTRFEQPRDFMALAQRMTSEPLPSIFNSALELGNIFNQTGRLTAASISCIGYCSVRHPDGGPTFEDCVRKCASR